MSIVKIILKYFYLSRIKTDSKELSAVERAMININDAKKVGILFNATNPDDLIAVTQYADMLKTQGKELVLLAFQDSKEKAQTDPRFFNKLDLNWYFIPVGEKIDQFKKQNFDILISAFVDECLPLEYIAATTRAKFRVGSFNDNKTSYYELMINNQKNKNLKYLLQQINHFLKVINP